MEESGLDRIRQAYAGQHGDSQKLIAAEGLKIIETLLRKNADYGNSAWTVPILAPGLSPREAIQCRMSDKVSRLSRLLSGETAQVQESVDDTMRDLAGYAILWLGYKVETTFEIPASPEPEILF